MACYDKKTGKTIPCPDVKGKKISELPSGTDVSMTTSSETTITPKETGVRGFIDQPISRDVLELAQKRYKMETSLGTTRAIDLPKQHQTNPNAGIDKTVIRAFDFDETTWPTPEQHSESSKVYENLKFMDDQSFKLPKSISKKKGL